MKNRRVKECSRPGVTRRPTAPCDIIYVRDAGQQLINIIY